MLLIIYLQKPVLGGVYFKKLSETKRIFLEDSFSEDEVNEVILNKDSDVSPGPDGFGFSFSKTIGR